MKISRMLGLNLPFLLISTALGLTHFVYANPTPPLKTTAFAETPAAPPAVMTKLNAGIDADKDRLVGIFKNIHQNPELGFMEVKTAGIVANELKTLGFEVKTGIAKTGVVGILRNGKGPTVMYRADMDANAVEEATGLPYASKVRVIRPTDNQDVPVAHMCGHDAHVTWMLGMAKALASTKDSWGGTLVVVAQPAEELTEGAKAMIDDGFYSKYGVPVPDYFLGLHTAPGPVGVVANASGVRMAGTEQLDVTFHGVGGHGSMPQMAKDPVIMASMAVVQYQIIVSRILDPQDTAVLTVGSIQAGTDNNVIPESALLKLNLRFFDEKTRNKMIDGIRNINIGIANTYGVSKDKMPTLVMKGGSTPLVNSADLVKRLNPALISLLGEKNVVKEMPPATGSEDVHLLLNGHKNVPFDFILVGVADPKVFAKARAEGKFVPYSAHNPNYIVELSAIPVGTKVASSIVMELLVKK